VESLLDAYRGNGLAVVGLDATERALDNRQVDELVLAAAPHALLDDTSEPSGTAQTLSARDAIADRLVTKARQTDAAIHFVNDAALAESIRGVGAFLRYRL
jgi:peptide subunit release factor 1 (eRF1)